MDADGAAKSQTLGMAFQIEVPPDGKGRRFTHVSPSCEALNGVSAEAAMADASAIYGLILPEYIESVARAEETALASLTPFFVEVPFRKPDGEVRWFQITSAPRLLPDGRTLWDGFQIDITERRKADRRLSIALDASRLGLWEYEIGAGRLYWSDRTKALYGLSPDAEVDFEVYQASIHPEDKALVNGAYEAVLAANGGDYSFEHRTLGADGVVRWVLAHGRVLTEGGKPSLVIGTSLDITERKQAEEARALLLGELNHRVKNDFQLMASVLAMQARRAENPQVKQELLKAQQRIVGFAQAHHNIYADPQSALLDLGAYVEGICRHLRDGLLADGDITIVLDLDPLQVDRDRAVSVGIIINELITNALKHAFKERDRGTIEVSLKPAQGGHRLIVADDGPGLAQASGGGLGQGLLRAFAARANAELTVLDGPGARFQLTLSVSAPG